MVDSNATILGICPRSPLTEPVITGAISHLIGGLYGTRTRFVSVTRTHDNPYTNKPLVRLTGIEPAPDGWKPPILPLDDRRVVIVEVYFISGGDFE